LKYQSRR